MSSDTVTTVDDCEVLVVGLGPVGAALAALLGDAGVKVLAIDKSTEVYPLPRAAHFDHEIMRVFQQLGIAEEVLRHARPVLGYEFRNAKGEVLVSFDEMINDCGPSGWPSSFMFSQPGLEHALRAKLRASGSVRLLLGASLQGLAAGPDGAEAKIGTRDGPLSVHAAYVIGCDGASSPVREAIGSRLEDLGFDEPWLVVDALLRPGARLPAVNLQICDPARPTTCVPMGPGRHRWEFMLLPGEQTAQVLDDTFIAGLLAKWDGEVEIERKAVYRFHGLVADRWRAGPVFLAGDAAHQMPPFAGQGMCSGIRDAANLAWKLIAVLRGRATGALLDTYQAEREPNTRAYIRLAMDMGRVVCLLDPELAQARDERMLAARRAGQTPIPPAAPPPLAGPGILEGSPGAGELFPQPLAVQGDQKMRLDDALGAGAWFITTAPIASTNPDLLRVGLDDARIAPFRGPVASWLAARQVEAVLVRPDRVVFGAGSGAVLLQAWSSALEGSDAPVAA